MESFLEYKLHKIIRVILIDVVLISDEKMAYIAIFLGWRYTN